MASGDVGLVSSMMYARTTYISVRYIYIYIAIGEPGGRVLVSCSLLHICELCAWRATWMRTTRV